MIRKSPCIDVLGLARCTGCFGCQAACSREAISVNLDQDGFYKPVVHRGACTQCGVCQDRCPVLATDRGTLPTADRPAPKVFAAWSKDDTLRLASSSGGIFSELARPAIDAGGGVAGCVWGYDWKPRHILSRTWPEVERMRGSKYVPSYIGNIYRDVVAHLNYSSTPLLFSGTPCQVAAMDIALTRKQRERVLLVDLVCHGVPSLRVFHLYLEQLFDGDSVARHTFRDKTLGWQTVQAESAGGCRYRANGIQDQFMAGFVQHHLYVMASCHACVFAGLPRPGDITLGDFWGCPEQWHDRKGVSLVLANSDAGAKALAALADDNRIELAATDMDTATRSSPRILSGKRDMPRRRRRFLGDVRTGVQFRDLVARHYPSKWRFHLSRFLQSESRWAFLRDYLRSKSRSLNAWGMVGHIRWPAQGVPSGSRTVTGNGKEGETRSRNGDAIS